MNFFIHRMYIFYTNYSLESKLFYSFFTILTIPVLFGVL